MDWGALALGAIPVLFGVQFIWSKVDKVLKAMKELGEVLTVIAVSFEDKKLEPTEVLKIKKEIGEAIAAFKAVIR